MTRLSQTLFSCAFVKHFFFSFHIHENLLAFNTILYQELYIFGDPYVYDSVAPHIRLFKRSAPTFHSSHWTIKFTYKKKNTTTQHNNISRMIFEQTLRTWETVFFLYEGLNLIQILWFQQPEIWWIRARRTDMLFNRKRQSAARARLKILGIWLKILWQIN